MNSKFNVLLLINDMSKYMDREEFQSFCAEIEALIYQENYSLIQAYAKQVTDYVAFLKDTKSKL